jgi:AraC-like DNA-binding protein
VCLEKALLLANPSAKNGRDYVSEEVSVRTLNFRVGVATRNDGRATTPDVGIPHVVAAAPQLLAATTLDERVRRMLEMSESGTAVTIGGLALEFNLSPCYLRRLFKHQTGVCMRAWLSEQRLQRAAQLLANGYMSVKEISHTVGYEHVSSFVRAFERRFAQAPTRYRKQRDYAKC